MLIVGQLTEKECSVHLLWVTDTGTKVGVQRKSVGGTFEDWCQDCCCFSVCGQNAIKTLFRCILCVCFLLSNFSSFRGLLPLEYCPWTFIAAPDLRLWGFKLGPCPTNENGCILTAAFTGPCALPACFVGVEQLGWESVLLCLYRLGQNWVLLKEIDHWLLLEIGHWLLP